MRPTSRENVDRCPTATEADPEYGGSTASRCRGTFRACTPNDHRSRRNRGRCTLLGVRRCRPGSSAWSRSRHLPASSPGSPPRTLFSSRARRSRRSRRTQGLRSRCCTCSRGSVPSRRFHRSAGRRGTPLGIRRRSRSSYARRCRRGHTSRCLGRHSSSSTDNSCWRCRRCPRRGRLSGIWRTTMCSTAKRADRPQCACIPQYPWIRTCCDIGTSRRRCMRTQLPARSTDNSLPVRDRLFVPRSSSPLCSTPRRSLRNYSDTSRLPPRSRGIGFGSWGSPSGMGKWGLDLR